MPKEKNKIIGKTIKLYFCPECKSKEVGYIFEFQNIFGIVPRMRCKNCKHEGFFPIMVIDVKSLNKLNKNKKNAGQRRQK